MNSINLMKGDRLTSAEKLVAAESLFHNVDNIFDYNSINSCFVRINGNLDCGLYIAREESEGKMLIAQILSDYKMIVDGI